MHTSPKRFRSGTAASLVLLVTLISSLSATSFAQGGESPGQRNIEEKIQELVQDLQTRETELDDLGRKIEKHEDLAAAAMLEKEVSERRSRYRRDVAELVELVLSSEDAGAAVAQGRAAATDLLQRDAQSMREDVEKVGNRIVELLDVMEKGSPEESDKARRKLDDDIPTADRLMKYLDANITQRKDLGLDVEAETEFLIKRLQVRADVIAGLLQSTKREIDDITARPGVDQDAEAQKELAALKRQRDMLAESQRLNVELMGSHGLGTTELRQGIISATGKLSQDVLDKEVASGLLRDWLAHAGDWLRTNGASLVFQALSFLLILLVFWLVARLARAAVRRGLDRSKLSVSNLARDFFIKMTGRLIMLLGFIIAIAQLGIEIAPLLAGLGIAGFVVGFALQDTLSNFASGLMILVYRPFDVGDVIEAGGVTGTVDQMNLVSTMVLTFDNQLLVVPNKQIWGGVIRNVTHQDKRRVDMTFGIGYSDDVPKAEKVLTDIVTNHDKVLKTPEPVVRLHELGESSVKFVVRPWAKTGDYWDVYWDITREVKRRFDEEGLSIPFPQRDVHLYHATPSERQRDA
jgi:small conductance mechanosensitive channel